MTQAFEAGDESHELQSRRVQPVRQLAQTLRNALRGFQGLGDHHRAGRVRIIGTELIELDGQDRELLINVVV